MCHAGDQLYVDQLQGPPLTETHLHCLALQDEARGGAEVNGGAHLNNEVTYHLTITIILVTVYCPGSRSFQYSPQALEVTALPTTAPVSSLTVTTACVTP